MKNNGSKLTSNDVLTVGSGIAALGGLVWTFADPSLSSMGFTAASTLAFGVSRQMGVNQIQEGHYEPDQHDL